MINKIKKFNLCLGCGLCSSIIEEKCDIRLNEQTGFYEPIIKSELEPCEQNLLKNLCPGINVVGDKNTGVWGALEDVYEAWSSDSDIRYKSASGGVVTSLAVYLIESKEVDAVLQVGVCKDDYLHNELHESFTKEDVLRNSQSRYAPALVFDKIKKILDQSSRIYAFVGKPCDIAAMQNFCREFPLYKKRIKYYISIFCAGMPSYIATEKLWKESKHLDSPISLKYRGDGWPGNFVAKFADGSDFVKSYNDSWGAVLGRHLGFRCKICPDGIGLLADISVGDSWNTKDGYPDFTDADGKCFCMIRTRNGVNLFNRAAENGYIVNNPLDVSRIKDMQRYQYDRRKLVGWRLLPVLVYSGFLVKFKNLNIWNQALSAPFILGLRNMWGTIKRMQKIKSKS